MLLPVPCLLFSVMHRHRQCWHGFWCNCIDIVWISSSSLFCPASRQTVSSCTSITSQSKAHLHQCWNWKTVSFRFLWAEIETCSFYQVFHQHSCHHASSYYRCHQHSCQCILSISRLSSPFSLTSNLAASELNLSHKYISWSHEAIIVCPCA